MGLKKITHYLSFFFTLTLFQAGVITAAEPPLELSAKFDLRRAKQAPFFVLMSKERTGIKAKLDADYERTFTITDSDTFLEKADNFAHIKTIEKKVVGGRRGLEELLDALAGEEVKIPWMYGTVFSTMEERELFVSSNPKDRSRLVGGIVPLIAMASGRGVHVQLDDENYCYNYGYAPGSGDDDLEADKTARKSGRSFGASIERNAYDPTDRDYLTDLSIYVSEASTKELREFYTAIFEILLKSKTTGIAKLDPDGQTIVSDFMAVYMAELDRHLMTGLKMYEWENALTEITMLAAYSVSDDGMTLDPRGGVENKNGRKLVASSELKQNQRLLGYFGVGTDGSGLDGANKRRRHFLTKQVVREMREVSPDVVSELEDLIDARPGADLYDDVMEYINDYDTQESVAENSDALIKTLVDFVMETRKHAAAISENVEVEMKFSKANN